MLTKPTPEVLNCLKRLSNPEFTPLLKFLMAENSMVLATLMNLTDEVNLRQFQGRAQAIHDLLSLIELAKIDKPTA